MNEMILADGSVVKFGNLAPDPNRVRALPAFGSTPQVKKIDRSKWDALIDAYAPGPDHAFLPPLRNQLDVGECNAEAAASLMEHVRAVQGLPYVQLSAADLYARINGGADNGSLLEDAMAELTARGIGTAQTSGLVWKDGIWKGPAPAAERARYRALEVLDCPDFDSVMSAVLQGFGIVSGIMWYPNYAPDQDGWLPAGQGRAGGHAIFGYKPERRGTTYGIRHLQSWGPNWCPRTKNTFVISEDQYRGPVGGWYAARSVTDEGGVVPPLVA